MEWLKFDRGSALTNLPKLHHLALALRLRVLAYHRPFGGLEALKPVIFVSHRLSEEVKLSLDSRQDAAVAQEKLVLCHACLDKLETLFVEMHPALVWVLLQCLRVAKIVFLVDRLVALSHFHLRVRVVNPDLRLPRARLGYAAILTQLRDTL